MTRERSHWFNKTFDSGQKRSLAPAGVPPSPAAATDHELEEVRLAARAETLTSCSVLAGIYEQKGANAGIVRLQLAQHADEAWARLEAHHHTPLGAGATEGKGASPVLAQPDKGSHPSASAPSGDGGRTRPGDRDEAAPSPLLERRLELIAESLDAAIDTVSGTSGRKVLGAAAASVAAYLRSIQQIARMSADVPEPQSLRVDETPTLRVVK